jgi:hypothetical protein
MGGGSPPCGKEGRGFERPAASGENTAPSRHSPVWREGGFQVVGTGHPSVPTTSSRAVRHRAAVPRVGPDDAPVVVRRDAGPESARPPAAFWR